MELVTGIIRLAAVVVLAFLAGRLVARFRLPAILGWLIAGMALGPHAAGLLSGPMMDAQWPILDKTMILRYHECNGYN